MRGVRPVCKARQSSGSVTHSQLHVGRWCPPIPAPSPSGRRSSPSHPQDGWRPRSVPQQARRLVLPWGLTVARRVEPPESSRGHLHARGQIDELVRPVSIRAGVEPRGTRAIVVPREKEADAAALEECGLGAANQGSKPRAGSNPVPATIDAEGLADAAAANPFSFTRTSPGNWFAPAAKPAGRPAARVFTVGSKGEVVDNHYVRLFLPA
jgi:hypothetical protein